MPRRKTDAPVGRPRIEVSKDEIVNLYNKYYNWNVVAEKMNMSIATLFLRKRELNIKKKCL